MGLGDGGRRERGVLCMQPCEHTGDGGLGGEESWGGRRCRVQRRAVEEVRGVEREPARA